MTTELEKQFFDTFGIEPRKVKICINTNHCSRKYKLCNNDCKHWKVVRTDYPQITDRYYLELICVLGYFEIVNKPNNCEELKKYILDWYLDLDDSEIIELKHQVQVIFEEER